MSARQIEQAALEAEAAIARLMALGDLSPNDRRALDAARTVAHSRASTWDRR